jgi:hypothetical protein
VPQARWAWGPEEIYRRPDLRPITDDKMFRTSTHTTADLISTARMTRVTPYRLSWIVFDIILFVGICMQVRNLDQSFWFDEVWVANTIVEPTFFQMMYYEGWLNTNPPLFLLLVRLFTQVFGISHMTMRLVPFLFGVLSILGMAYLAVRLLKPWYALLATGLFCLSPVLVFYATSLKPYTTDTFVAVILLIIGYHYSITASRKAFTSAILAFAVLGFLSYQAIVFLPFFLVTAYLDSRNRLAAPSMPAKWLDMGLLCSCAAVVTAINYFCFLEPNRGQALLEFWKIGYQGSTVLGFIRYISTALASLTSPFFFSIYPFLPANILVVMIVGLGWIRFFLNQGHRTRVSANVAMLLGLPTLALGALNLLGQYPITTRLVLFLFPVVTVLFASGIQAAVDLCLRLAAKAKIIHCAPIKMEGLLVAIVFGGIACLFVARLAVEGLQPYVPGEPVEDAVGAIRYLSAEHGNGDLLYVHSTMHEHYKFYTKSFSITTGQVIQGKIGSPCCPRQYINDRGLSAADVVPAEVARLDISSRNIKVRLLLTDRPDHWYSFLRRDEPYEFEQRLSEKGCFRAKTKKFKGIQIQEYSCGANRSL